jgi:penicillin-binding protein 2
MKTVLLKDDEIRQRIEREGFAETPDDPGAHGSDTLGASTAPAESVPAAATEPAGPRPYVPEAPQ